MRNIGAAVPKQHAAAVLALTRTIFSQPTPEAAHEAVSHPLQLLEPRFAKAATLLREAEADVLAYMAFPVDHWRSISSTNAIERLNAEIDRRAKVVGIFPNTAALLRLATAVVQDQHDEWQDDRRHLQPAEHGPAAPSPRSAAAHQRAHGGIGRLAHRRREDPIEFTPPQGA
jgi:putative transposase